MMYEVIGPIKGSPEAEQALKALRENQDRLNERKAFLKKQLDGLEAEHTQMWKDFFDIVKKGGKTPHYKYEDGTSIHITKGEHELILVHKEDGPKSLGDILRSL